MQTGSPSARVLKLADRISNLTALGFVHDIEFVVRYIDETRACILPYAENVSADMCRELHDLVASRARWKASAMSQLSLLLTLHVRGALRTFRVV